LRYIIIS